MKNYKLTDIRIETTPKQLRKSLNILYKGFLESELYNHLSREEIQKITDDFIFLSKKVRK